MKRPAAAVGFTCWITLICAQYLPMMAAKVIFFISAFITVASIIALFLRRGRHIISPLVISATVCLSLILFFGVSQYKYMPVAQLDGKETQITATITEPPMRKSGRYYYKVQVTQVELEGAPQRFDLRLSAMQPIQSELYDEIKCNVRFRLPQESGGFDSQSYYKSQDIYLYAYPTNLDIQVNPVSNKPLIYHIKTLRQTLRDKILRVFPNDEGGLMVGLLIGDRSHIDENVQEQFRMAGVSHMLALSGMHFTVITTLLLMLFSFMRIGRKKSALFIIIFSIFYMALVGFGASVVRAGIMIIIYQSSSLFSRKPDSLTSLGIAVLLMCIVSPFGAFDTAFMLSVSGTLGIVVMAKPVSERISKHTGRILPSFVVNVVAVTLSATIFTLPFIILSFGEVSIVSILTNVLLSLPLSCMLMLTFIFAAFSLIPFAGFVFYPAGLLAGMLAKLILKVVQLISGLPFAVLPSSQSYIRICLLAALLLFGSAFVIKRRKPPLRMAALLSVIVLLFGILSSQLMNNGAIDVSVLDVGNGASVALTYGGNAAIVSCGGDKWAGRDTVRYLRKKGTRKLNVMLLPALDSHSAGGASEVIQSYEPETLICPDSGSQKSQVEYFLSDNTTVCGFSGSELRLWNEVGIRSMDTSSGSICHLSVKGIEILLLSGTVDVEEIPSEWRNPDVIICSEIMEGIDSIPCQYVFLSMDIPENLTDLPAEDNVFMTAGDGSLVMSCFDGREVRLQRDEA